MTRLPHLNVLRFGTTQAQPPACFSARVLDYYLGSARNQQSLSLTGDSARAGGLASGASFSRSPLTCVHGNVRSLVLSITLVIYMP